MNILNLKNTFLPAIAILVFFAFFGFYGFVSSDASDNMTGFAWGADLSGGNSTNPGGVGWISFNCTNDGSCDPAIPIDYGVNTDMATGYMDGYAWAGNSVDSSINGFGWLKFGGLSGFPSGPGTVADNARVDFSTGQVTGWARFCAVFEEGTGCPGTLRPSTETGGWDGWVSLSGDGHVSPDLDPNPPEGGVTYDSTSGSFVGYAWGGSDVVGWIDFSQIELTPPTQVTNGVCGTANQSYPAGSTGYGSDTFCDSGLLQVGLSGVPPFPTSGNPTTWTCRGLNGGVDASCTASVPRSQTSLCESPPNGGGPYSSAPSGTICAMGATPSPVILVGNLWEWTCSSPNVPPEDCSATSDGGGGGGTDLDIFAANPGTGVYTQGVLYVPDVTTVVDLKWTSQNPNIIDPSSCVASYTDSTPGSPVPAWQGAKANPTVSGVIQTSVAINSVQQSARTFIIECTTGSGNSTLTDQVTVIKLSPSTPTINSVTYPACMLPPGGDATLTWSTSNMTECSLSVDDNNTKVIFSVPLSSSGYTVTVPPGGASYELTCRNTSSRIVSRATQSFSIGVSNTCVTSVKRLAPKYIEI